MPDVITCHACGASNAPDAPWCTLCFATFAAAEPAVGMPAASREQPVQPRGQDAALAGPERPAPAASESAPPPAPGEQLSLLEEDRRAWQCRFCETKVDVAEVECPVCRQSIYDTFGGAEEQQPKIDQATALRWSALPGAGHVRLGQGILGVAIALAVMISGGFGLVMMTSGRVTYGAVLVFIAFTTWLASIHDVYRIMSNEPTEVLLRPRVVSVLAGFVFMVIVAASVSAQSVISP